MRIMVSCETNKQTAFTVQTEGAVFICTKGSERMPHRPKKPCRFPGCPNLTDEQYCDKHRKAARRQYDKYERDANVHRTYGFRWQKIRKRYVAAHPLCELCLKEGRYTPVEEVHHILPVSKGGTHDESNLMSLCRSCHNKIHIEMGDR